MVVLDLLGRRILRELHGPAMTFRALHDACDTNARVLNTRLTELMASGLVEHGEGGYCMTEEGRRLEATLQPLLGWVRQWERQDSDALDTTDREQSSRDG